MEERERRNLNLEIIEIEDGDGDIDDDTVIFFASAQHSAPLFPLVFEELVAISMATRDFQSNVIDEVFLSKYA